MPNTNVHIINHTHWDREWFVTSVVTSRWIPRLIDKLSQLVSKNPEYKYLFDGQTLVIEDLLDVAPEYKEKMLKLVRDGHLLIGPYYSQPDWQLTSEELLVRNLVYGLGDVKKLGGKMDTGWLVDTFGHISQSPQIHRLFGIESVFVWRGVPELEPYFNWQAPDGSEVLTINLFGGYRNLYGITHAPEVAHKRLSSEVDKLLPFYPTPDLPLFDGYDLEGNPEDPVRFYAENGSVRADINLTEATPHTFACEISNKNLPLPTISTELNSGKYGATFPGTLSTRTYLKVMARDSEQMLFQICEPLAVMAAMKGRAYPVATYEAWGRKLLQNAVHDCICGVSVDQVHEKMEYSYREIFAGMQADVKESVAAILHDFAAGTYVLSTNAFAMDTWQRVDDELLYVKTDGVGVWEVQERITIEQKAETLSTFAWQNDYFAATISEDGIVKVGDAAFGQLTVFAEHGDTYSNEKGEKLGVLEVTSALTLKEKSEKHAVVTFDAAWKSADANVTATVELYFDETSLIKWQIDLDSRGTNFSVEMVFETRESGELYAGMPFDVVKRDFADTDLLPRKLDAEMKSVLLGQRELNSTTTFPFHDFVALGSAEKSVAVFAEGIRSYDADPNGTISITLRRSVEWLTEGDLKNRQGDAGPFFYVPDARCERTLRHELALAFVTDAPASMTMQKMSATYQNPPLVVETKGNGSEKEWQLLQENLPLSSLTLKDGTVLARFYNPTPEKQAYSQSYAQTDVWGAETGVVAAIAPKQIQTVEIPASNSPREGENLPLAEINLLSTPAWRVGDNQGLPAGALLDQLSEKVAERERELQETEAKLEAPKDEKERLLLQHRWYVLKREQVEFKLSRLLNERKLAENGALRYGYLYEPDQEIADISLELNNLRIKRRVFDYVVEAIE